MNPALVMDCSATLAMAFEDERDERAIRMFRLVSDRGALVPAHWPLEVANVLRISERKKGIKPGDSKDFISLLASLPIQVAPPCDADAGLAELYDTAGRFSLTAYDAAYWMLARDSGLPLASRDDDLVEAARQASIALLA
jgi:predicted nucleic acid-binding protein